MSKKDLEVGLLIKAESDLRDLKQTINQLKKAGSDVSKLENQAQALSQTMAQLGKEQSTINRFKQFENQLTETNKELEELERREKAISKGDGGNYSQLVNKKKKLTEQQKALTESVRKTSQELKRYNIDVKSLGTAEEKLARKTDKINRQIDKLNRKANKKLKLAQSLDEAKASAKGLNATLRKVGTVIGAVFVTGKIAGFFTSAISGSANLEQALARVKAVSGATSDEMATIKSKAEELGASTRYTATQAAEGFEILARAGLDAEQQIQAIPGVLALAQGQSISLAESAQFVGDAITIMGGSFAETGFYADVLAKGASQANTTVPQLANAISYAGQYAKEAGFDIGGLVGILDVLAQNGLRGERAGTALKNIFAQLQDPTSKAAQELEKLGIKTDSLSGVINGLKAAGDNGTVAINAFGTEAGPALRALLTGGTEALNKYTNGLRNAGGAAQKAAKEMDNTFVGSLKGLGSAWDSVKNKLGEPILEPVRNQINRLSGIIRNWVASGEIKKLGDYFAKVFGDMARVVVDFVENFTLDDTTRKVAEFSSEITEKFDKIGNTFSLVYNILSAGFNTISSIILGVASVVTKAVAKINSGLASLTSVIPGLGELSKSLKESAGGMDAVSQAFSEKAVDAFNRAADAANKVQESYKALTTESEKNAKAVKDNEVAINAEITAFNEKSKKLIELKELEASYAAQTVKDHAREVQIINERMQLEAELEEKAKGKILQAYELKDAEETVNEITKQSTESISEKLKRLEGLKTKTPEVTTEINRLKTELLSTNTAFKSLAGSISDAATAEQLTQIGRSAFEAFNAGKITAQEYEQVVANLKEKNSQLKNSHDKTTQATRESTTATKESTTATQADTTATDESTVAKERAGNASANLAAATNSVRDAYAESATAIEKFDQVMESYVVKGMSIGQYWQVVAKANRAAKSEMKLYEMTLADATSAMESLADKTADGTISQEDLESATNLARQSVSRLNETELNDLNSSIDKAREKMLSLEEQAKDTAQNIADRLADATGSEVDKINRKYDQEAAEIREKAQSGVGQDAYNQALADLEKLRKIELEKQKKADDEAKAAEQKRQAEAQQKAAQRATQQSSTSQSQSQPLDTTAFLKSVDESLRNSHTSQQAVKEFSKKLGEGVAKVIEDGRGDWLKESVPATIQEISNQMETFRKGRGDW